MIKYKKLTYYVAIVESAEDDLVHNISDFYYRERYPKRTIEHIPENYFKDWNFDLGVVTFKVKVE